MATRIINITIYGKAEYDYKFGNYTDSARSCIFSKNNSFSVDHPDGIPTNKTGATVNSLTVSFRNLDETARYTYTYKVLIKKSKNATDGHEYTICNITEEKNQSNENDPKHKYGGPAGIRTITFTGTS